MSKHTPGPWKVHYEGSGDFVVYSGDVEIGTAWSQHAHFMGSGEAELSNEANAHLIAAAPEMFDALERIANGDIGPSNANDQIIIQSIVNTARVAVAKAKGETP